MNYLKDIETQASAWADISVHPHRFVAREFRLRKKEIGHLHSSGELDIPFPRTVRDELLKEGLAREHRWVPNSGWVSFHIAGKESVESALWLLRLSYLCFRLKVAVDPRALFEDESEELRLNSRLKTLIEAFAHLEAR